jgi:heptosyltransferase I
MINGVPRILIIRLSAIGDVVRVLPALHALRDAHPHAQIDWAVEPRALDIIQDHPALDRVLVFERGSGQQRGFQIFRRFCRELRDNRYDVVLDFHGLLKSGLMARATRAKQRIGFARPRAKEGSWLFTKERVQLVSCRMNRIEENLELCKVLGARRPTLEVVIEVPEYIQDEIDDWFEAVFDAGKKIVLIHAPVDRPEKQWPLENYAVLTDMLLADGRYEVLLTCGPGQEQVVGKICALAKREPETAPDIPSLKHFAWMTQRASVYFGGDTGPMHIASAMGTPVAAVFGGTDPAKHAPLRKPSEVLYAGPENPPERVDLRVARENLARITPEMAFDACVRLAKW